MKRKTPAVIIFACFALLYSSCYKTGEVIYQTECKPDSLYTISPVVYDFGDFGIATPFNASMTYDANQRLIAATNLISGIPRQHYDFIYDSKNNLIRINASNIDDLHALSPSLYITFSYPPGTSASLSSTAEVQIFVFDSPNNTFDLYKDLTYNFNTEFQLTSIFQGTTRIEQLTYDNGGNCLVDSEFNINNILYRYYVYPAYDNKINPARSDRSIQLFLKMYSKNNPTITDDYSSNNAGNIPFVLFNSSSGSYTYNADGYPITYAGNFFADYNCVPVPNPVISPGPGSQ